MMRTFIQHIYHRTIFLIDYLAACIGFKKIASNSVALIRVDAIGDFILWLPAARGLRRAFPEAHITLIGNATWIDLARDLPYWDEVIAINTREFAFRDLVYRWKMIRLIASKGFQIAIQPTFSRILSTGDSLVRATHAPERIGIRGDLSNLSLTDIDCAKNWYTKLHSIGHQANHELERNRLAMKILVGVEVEKILPHLDFVSAIQSDLIESLALYVVIAPGASWGGKRWSIQNYSKIAKFIADKFRMQVVVCGSKEEFDLGATIQNEVSGVINLAGKTSLREMASILKGAKLVIGNDSSAIHIANAVHTQSICILGGGHFGRFFPYPKDFLGPQPMLAFKKMDCYQCNWRCTLTQNFSNGAPCISGVSLDEIKLLVEGVLSNNFDISRSS